MELQQALTLFGYAKPPRKKTIRRDFEKRFNEVSAARRMASGERSDRYRVQMQELVQAREVLMNGGRTQKPSLPNGVPPEPVYTQPAPQPSPTQFPPFYEEKPATVASSTDIFPPPRAKPSVSWIRRIAIALLLGIAGMTAIIVFSLCWMAFR